MGGTPAMDPPAFRVDHVRCVRGQRGACLLREGEDHAALRVSVVSGTAVGTRRAGCCVGRAREGRVARGQRGPPCGQGQGPTGKGERRTCCACRGRRGMAPTSGARVDASHVRACVVRPVCVGVAQVTATSCHLHYYSTRPALGPIVVGVLKVRRRGPGRRQGGARLHITARVAAPAAPRMLRSPCGARCVFTFTSQGYSSEYLEFELKVTLIESRDKGGDHEVFLIEYPEQVRAYKVVVEDGRCCVVAGGRGGGVVHACGNAATVLRKCAVGKRARRCTRGAGVPLPAVCPSPPPRLRHHAWPGREEAVAGVVLGRARVLCRLPCALCAYAGQRARAGGAHE